MEKCRLKLIQSSGLNLRAEANTQSEVLSTPPMNTRVCVEKSITVKTEKWSYVTTEIDRDFGGWVLSRFLGDKSTLASSSLDEARSAIKTKDYRAALNWSQRAVQSTESSESLNLLLQSYMGIGDKKMVAKTEARIATYRQLNPLDQDLSRLSENTPPLAEDSLLSKQLNCKEQIKKKESQHETYLSIPFTEVDPTRNFEALLPAKSDALIDVRALETANNLLTNNELEDCFFTASPKNSSDCKSLNGHLAQLEKFEKEEGLGPDLKFLDPELLRLERLQTPALWPEKKANLQKHILQSLIKILESHKGVVFNLHGIASASEYDRFWLEKNFFSITRTEQTPQKIDAETLKFAICNFFEVTYQDNLQREHTLGPQATLLLADSVDYQKEPNLRANLLKLAINEFKDFGWVSSQQHESATYASEAEQLLNREACDKDSTESPQFKSLIAFEKALKERLTQPNTDDWAQLFPCHSLKLEQITTSFTELISRSKATLLLLEAKNDILQTKAIINEKKRTLQFKKIRLDLDKNGRWVRIAK